MERRRQGNVLEAEIRDLLHACAGVIQHQRQRAITPRMPALLRQLREQGRDVLPVQESRFRQRRPFRRNRRHALSDVEHLGQASAHILEEGPQARQPLIPRRHLIVPRRLQMLQEAEHPLERQILDLQLTDGRLASADTNARNRRTASR